MQDAKVQLSEIYSLEQGFHREKNILWIRFEKDFEKIKLLKTITKPFFSNTQKCWYVADNSFNRQLFSLPPKTLGKAALQKISEVNLPAMKRYQEHLILKGFSQNTIKTYTVEFAQLLYMLKEYNVDKLSAEKLRGYILYCHRELKLSENQIHSRMNAATAAQNS